MPYRSRLAFRLCLTYAIAKISRDLGDARQQPNEPVEFRILSRATPTDSWDLLSRRFYTRCFCRNQRKRFRSKARWTWVRPGRDKKTLRLGKTGAFFRSCVIITITIWFTSRTRCGWCTNNNDMEIDVPVRLWKLITLPGKKKFLVTKPINHSFFFFIHFHGIIF